MSNPNDFIIENGVLKKYVGPGGDVVIPESVKSIGQGAFRDCTRVTGIAIPPSVKSIRKWAFWGCENLTEIEFPATLEHIGQNLLKSCRSLKKVTIPEGVTRIMEFAFEGCAGLESVSFPDSLLAIEKGAFKHCGMLTHVTIPQHVRWIGEYAFYGCSQVQSLQILSEEALMERGTFDFPGGALDLTGRCRVSMPDPLAKALALNSLKSEFNAPSLVFSLLRDPEQFSGEFKKKLIALLKKDPLFCLDALVEQDDGVSAAHFLELREKLTLEEIDEYLERTDKASQAPNVRAVLLNCREKRFEQGERERIYRENEEKELGIREKSVADWRKTFKFTISDGTVCISGYKKDERTVAVPEKIGKNTVTEIGAGAFARPWSLSRASRRSETDDETEAVLILPDTVRSIGSHAFEYSAFSSIALPKTGVTLAPGAFSDACIKTIQLPADLKLLPNNLFFRCHFLEEAAIPEGVTVIGDQAFFGCESLKSVTIPESVTTLADQAFVRCESLASLTIPKSVTKIGRAVFYGCVNLTLHAPAGSCAARYARENGIRFEAIGD